jgi:DNA modification methylase
MKNEINKKEIGYKSVLDFGREAKVEFPHNVGEYPTKILPQVIELMVVRFSEEGDTILDPFCGCGTVAVEAKKHGRNSINYDVVPLAIKLTKKKLALTNPLNEFITKKTTHIVELQDARKIPLNDESVDAVITDIPYFSMIKYSDLQSDLSNIEDYQKFLIEIAKAFEEIHRVLKKGKYCVIFVADYRVGAARMIYPLHADVINIMRELGFVLFDTYIWRYYRSGSFRPFGKRPFQAMNLHIYILVFYKPKEGENFDKKNRPIRYRKRLIEKLSKTRE